MRRFLALPLLVALGGCVIHAPSTVSVAEERPSTAWVEQLKLRIAPAAPGARVAAAWPTSWHRVRLTVGRLDGATPPAVKTLDPFENEVGSALLGQLTPGAEHWVQVDLLNVASGGVERIVGSGRLGGGGQKVLFNPGANAIPIEVWPVPSANRLDMGPTPLSRRSREQSERVIIIHESAEPWSQPEPVFDETDSWGPVIDWILSDDEESEDEWEWEDEEEEEDDELDLEQMGDWLPESAALR